MDERTIISLYKSMVHPHVEFANSVWCPFKVSDIKETEEPLGLSKTCRDARTDAGTTLLAVEAVPPSLHTN